MLRFEDLRVRDNQDLDRDFFNRRYRLIAESLAEFSDDLRHIIVGQVAGASAAQAATPTDA